MNILSLYHQAQSIAKSGRDDWPSTGQVFPVLSLLVDQEVVRVGILDSSLALQAQGRGS